MKLRPGFLKVVAIAAYAFTSHIAISDAYASEVSFVGGFTSFRGPVATAAGAAAASVHTEINGVTVFADEALPGAVFGYENFGIGLKKALDLRNQFGDPVQTVEFSRILFSQPSANEVSFVPVSPIDVQIGSTFKIGTFTVTNGSWFGNSAEENIFPDTEFGFTITTQSKDPTLNGIIFTDTLRFVVTNPSQANATVETDADYFYLSGHKSLGTISVQELTDPNGNPTSGNTGSVDLVVKIGSIIPVALEHPTGAAFIGNQLLAVPEPSTIFLMLLGLLGVTYRLRNSLRPGQAR